MAKCQFLLRRMPEAIDTARCHVEMHGNVVKANQTSWYRALCPPVPMLSRNYKGSGLRVKMVQKFKMDEREDGQQKQHVDEFVRGYADGC